MEVGNICGRSNMNVLLKSEQLSSSSELMKSMWLPSSSSAFQGNFFPFDCYYLSCSSAFNFLVDCGMLNFSNGFLSIVISADALYYLFPEQSNLCNL